MTKVYVCTPWGRVPEPRYWRHILALQGNTTANGIDFQFSDIAGKGGVADGHNQLIEHFLGTGYDWIFMLDNDAVVHPSSLIQMMAHRKKVVTALAFRSRPPYTPTQYRERAANGEWEQDYEWIRDFLIDHTDQLVLDSPCLISADDTLVEIERGGTHVMLVHRDVIEEMSPPWFQATRETGAGSDMYFTEKIRELDYKIYCDMAVVSGHLQGDYCASALDYLAWAPMVEYVDGQEGMSILPSE